MPKRTINTALGTYINKNGVSEYGFKGDEVEVHPDHVDRFDELNVDAGAEVEHPREEVALITAQGTTSGLNTAVSDDAAAESTAGDDTGDKPKRSRSK